MTVVDLATVCVRSFIEWVDGDGGDVTDDDRDRVRRFREALADID